MTRHRAGARLAEDAVLKLAAQIQANPERSTGRPRVQTEEKS